VERDVISDRLVRVVETALDDRELVVSCAVLDSTRADVLLPFASIGLDIPEHLVAKQRLFDMAIGALKAIIQSADGDRLGGVELHLRRKLAAPRTLANPFGRIARVSATRAAYAGVPEFKIKDFTEGSPYPGIAFVFYEKELS
jgi:hypothetical protein